MNFITDDYFFLKISRADNISQFLNFFFPIREHSFKPVSSEVYFFLIHFFRDNTVIGHIIAFLVFFVGLYYLEKIILKTTGNHILAHIVTFLYGINFTHIFQLYYFGTFQEIALFTFLMMATWYFLVGKTFRASIFFVLALMSKETAALYGVFLPVFIYFFHRERFNKYKKSIVVFVVIAAVFTLVYQYSLSFVTKLENYRIQLNPKLYVNNVMWYFLWGLGLPNYMPDYMVSIFKPPIKEFWKVFRNFPETKIYFTLLFSYLAGLTSATLVYLYKNKKELGKTAGAVAFCLFGFVVFIGPIGFFLHKWMVRLALPLIFISALEGYLLYAMYKKGGLFKKAFYLLIGLYILFNFYGIKVHESSSTFFLESRVSDNLRDVIEENRETISSKKYIYFKDSEKKDFNPWGQSKHLKTTLSNQNFLDLYFPKKDITAIYSFEQKEIPKDSYVINSLDILTP